MSKNQLKISGRPLYLLLIVLSIFVCGCTSAPRTVRTINDVDLTELCLRHDVDWQLDSVSQVVTLSGYSTKARALIGSDVVMIDSDQVSLSAPVKRYRNAILVPADFERRVIDRLKIQVGISLERFNTIVIDPGHGGKDPGAISRSGYQEKEVNLDIAKRLKREFERRGIKVILTRKVDKFLSLGERTEIATRANADLFISIHANANKSKSINGLEVYYFDNLLPEDKKEDQRLKNKGILYQTLSMNRNSSPAKAIVSEMLAGYKKSGSKPLAKHLAEEVSKAIGAKNNGAMDSRYHVLRNNFIPAVLIEVGYLSHTKEERLLKSDEYRAKVARAITQSVLNYDK